MADLSASFNPSLVDITSDAASSALILASDAESKASLYTSGVDNPIFAGVTITGLTPLSLVAADVNKKLESVSLGDGLDYGSGGTLNLVTSEINHDLLLNVHQDVNTDKSPIFAGAVLTPVTSLPNPVVQNKIIFYQDSTESCLYFGKWSTTSTQTDAVAHWKMNDNAENTTVLESINSLDGTSQRNTNLMSVPGKINTALSFDGTNDYITVADNDLIDVGTSDFAISFQVKSTNTGVQQRLICKRDSSSPYNIGYEIYYSDTNMLGFLIGDGAGYAGDTFTDVTGFFDGEWHHIVLNFDRDAYVTPYLDGVPKTGKIISTRQGSLSNAVELVIGAFRGAYAEKFTGSLDDIRLYNRLLTEQEIANLYSNGAGTEKIPAKYQSFNFSLSLIQESSEGELPKTSLVVSNVTQFLQEFIEELDGLVGAKIILSIVHADSLYEDYAELQTEFDVLATRLTAMDVSFQIGGMNLIAQRFPLHRYFADLCRHKFKSARCGYTGSATTCNRRLADCRELNNSARFGGFPGLESGTIRIA